MSAPTCYSPIQLCAIRAARLDPTGVPLPGANNLYVTSAVVDVNMTPVISAGSKFEQKNGCGAVCVSFEDCDHVESWTLAMNLCTLDAELIEMLTGGTTISSGGKIIGYQAPAGNAACGNGVSFEAWSKMWDTDQQAVISGKPGYFQFGFPKTTWVIGQLQLKDGIITVPMTGKGTANVNFYNGPANDWPVAITTTMAWQQVGGLPTSVCGYQTLVGS